MKPTEVVKKYVIRNRGHFKDALLSIKKADNSKYCWLEIELRSMDKEDLVDLYQGIKQFVDENMQEEK